jgi:hypothetical protein
MVGGRGPKHLGCGGSFQAANSGTRFSNLLRQYFGEEYIEQVSFPNRAKISWGHTPHIKHQVV